MVGWLIVKNHIAIKPCNHYFKMFKKTPARKRKRAFRRIIGISIIILVLLVLVGGVVYYFISLKFNKPLYVSPLSKKIGHEPAFGSSADEDDTMSILKKSLKEKNIELDSVTASGSAYVARLKNGGSVIFSSEKDLFAQVSSLQFILSRLTMEGRTFSRLDLQFEKPIVVFKD